MKRFGILLCITLVLASFAAFAEESVLIDFATLVADREDGQNEATFIDFANKAGAGFTEEEKALMKTSLAIENWEIELASSAQTVTNEAYSYVKAAPVREGATRYGGETVLGVRVHFPEAPYNSYAIVKPPFDIPAYEKADENDANGTKFEGYGVVKNVGVLKSLSVNVYGKNFPHGLGLILEDQNNVQKTIFMSYLDFDGWKTITWNNPNYITDVRNREIRKMPLYPQTTPLMKLNGIILYRDAAHTGGDFVTYIKDINMTYDKAFLEVESDIDDEALWNILTDREEARRNAEYQRLGNKQVLRFLEQQKMHAEEDAATEAPAE